MYTAEKMLARTTLTIFGAVVALGGAAAPIRAELPDPGTYSFFHGFSGILTVTSSGEFTGKCHPHLVTIVDVRGGSSIASSEPIAFSGQFDQSGGAVVALAGTDAFLKLKWHPYRFPDQFGEDAPNGESMITGNILNGGTRTYLGDAWRVRSGGRFAGNYVASLRPDEVAPQSTGDPLGIGLDQRESAPFRERVAAR
jgi:hypothetical protein